MDFNDFYDDFAIFVLSALLEEESAEHSKSCEDDYKELCDFLKEMFEYYLDENGVAIANQKAYDEAKDRFACVLEELDRARRENDPLAFEKALSDKRELKSNLANAYGDLQYSMNYKNSIKTLRINEIKELIQGFKDSLAEHVASFNDIVDAKEKCEKANIRRKTMDGVEEMVAKINISHEREKKYCNDCIAVCNKYLNKYERQYALVPVSKTKEDEDADMGR